MISANRIKKDFPIFAHNRDLVYLDSTATSLKPKTVIDSVREYYENYSANIYRGIYDISEKATEAYEKTRRDIASFINANSSDEVIFTRNTTESINLIMYSLGRKMIHENDEIVISIMEHHSNFVPWQILCNHRKAQLSIIDINDEGILYDIDSHISKKTKILAITYISNVLGTVNPIKQIIQKARKINPYVIVIVDGAQAVAHMQVDMQELGCDFFAFSSHKMFGPTGVGVLWGKKKFLNDMLPFQFGGEMIESVSLGKTTFKKTPHKFEAGTPDIAGVIGLGKAVAYIQSVGWNIIKTHEEELTQYAMEQLERHIPEIRVFGPREDRLGIISFIIPSIHPHDIAEVLNEDHIAIRAGNHCAMPLHKRLHIFSTCRASFFLYNTEEDVDKLIRSLKQVIHLFC